MKISCTPPCQDMNELLLLLRLLANELTGAQHLLTLPQSRPAQTSIIIQSAVWSLILI